MQDCKQESVFIGFYIQEDVMKTTRGSWVEWNPRIPIRTFSELFQNLFKNSF